VTISELLLFDHPVEENRYFSRFRLEIAEGAAHKVDYMRRMYWRRLEDRCGGCRLADASAWQPKAHFGHLNWQNQFVSGRLYSQDGCRRELPTCLMYGGWG